MEYAYILPTAAFLADVAVLLFLFSDWRGGLDRPLLGMYLSLMGLNLSVAYMMGAGDADTAWFFLFVMRNFLFLLPPCFLWLALRLSGRASVWPLRLAFAYAAILIVLADFDYLSGSHRLVAGMFEYSWGFFPDLAPLARGAVGGLMALCLVPAFAALFRPQKWPDAILKHGPRAGRVVVALFVVWWLTLLLAVLPLTGVDLFPPGSAMDALAGVSIAVFLRERSSGPAAGVTVWLMRVAGMLASASFGVFVTFFFLAFLLPAQAIATGIAGAITALVALLAFQAWFSTEPGSAVSRGGGGGSGRPQEEILRTEHGLTRQEAVICRELHAGTRRDRIIELLGITSGTFRNHLSEIYRKTVDTVEAPADGTRDKLQRLTVFLKKTAAS